MLFIQVHFCGSHKYPYQSLLLSTTVLNDIIINIFYSNYTYVDMVLCFIILSLQHVCCVWEAPCTGLEMHVPLFPKNCHAFQQEGHSNLGKQKQKFCCYRTYTHITMVMLTITMHSYLIMCLRNSSYTITIIVFIVLVHSCHTYQLCHLVHTAQVSSCSPQGMK